ncbi:hypothetical protein ACLBP9_31435, partial [Klebsiella pneumoniae]|uniref:hypothetical protein n=1 Tax=Klebsiella pneumoniae TaxID=573 RepID=UPI003968B0C3
ISISSHGNAPRDDANEIISLVNGFITDMSPEYATLISYLLRIAKQRNAVCNMELERYGPVIYLINHFFLSMYYTY